MELLPFDINEYRADPSRLRNKDGRVALTSSEVLGVLVIRWGDCDHELPVAYGALNSPPQGVYLRLAPKTRTVAFRLLRTNESGKVRMASSDDYDLNALVPCSTAHWIDGIETREVPA